MAIIVDKNGRRIYKTIGYLAYDDKENADKLDDFLTVEIGKIEEKLREKGLLVLRGKNGSIEFWFNLGVELRNLWNQVRTKFNLPDTFLPYFFKAVFDNSETIRPQSGRADRLKNAYFYYCYIIAGFPWKEVLSVGSWRQWIEFLDSKRIRADPRIIDWFVDRKVMEIQLSTDLHREEWFRRITREVRSEFHNIDTTVLSKKELYDSLDEILSKVVSRL
jgi:hypothetical protein